MPSKRKRLNRSQQPRKRPSLDTIEGGRPVPEDNDENFLDYQDEPMSKSNSAYTSGPINADTGQRSAFPIPAGTAPSNLENPPLNAADYLNRVNKEASSRPCIVHVQRPQQQRVVQFGGRTLKSYSDGPTPTAAVPVVHQTTPPAVAKTFTADMTWYRSFLITFKHAKSTLLSLPHTPLPKRYSDPEVIPQTASKWREFFLNPENPPTVSLVNSFDHALLMKLIAYLHKWVSASMSPLLSRWIYALLVRLPETLTGDEIAILRELAKKCILVRNNPSQPLTQVTICCLDMTISIVAGVYSQKDLITNLA